MSPSVTNQSFLANFDMMKSCLMLHIPRTYNNVRVEICRNCNGNNFLDRPTPASRITTLQVKNFALLINYHVSPLQRVAKMRIALTVSGTCFIFLAISCFTAYPYHL